MNPKDRKVVLVTRRTRLQDLIAHHHTLEQARFYLEHLNADFGDYLKEDQAYRQALQSCTTVLQAWGRYQVVDRRHLPNFVFGPQDLVVTLGQDGLVANTLKYLDGQPLIGVNPEPSRWDGLLLPFEAAQLSGVLLGTAHEHRSSRAVTMAEARLSDGQVLRAVNELFIGPRTQGSALYEIALGERHELQSSSGLIVATGLGSTAWLKSIVTGSRRIAQALQPGAALREHEPLPWDADRLQFAVREPFVSRMSSAELVFGDVTPQQPLKLRSRMPEHGVIFSDGMEADFLQFSAGMEATIGLAATRGCLVM